MNDPKQTLYLKAYYNQALRQILYMTLNDEIMRIGLLQALRSNITWNGSTLDRLFPWNPFLALKKWRMERNIRIALSNVERLTKLYFESQNYDLDNPEKIFTSL